MVYKKDVVVQSYPKNSDGTIMIHERMNNFGDGCMNDYMEAFEVHDVHIDKSNWNKNIGMSDEKYSEILSEKKIDFDDYVKHRDDTLKRYINNNSKPIEDIDFTLQNPNKKRSVSFQMEEDQIKQDMITEIETQMDNIIISINDYEHENISRLNDID